MCCHLGDRALTREATDILYSRVKLAGPYSVRAFNKTLTRYAPQRVLQVRDIDVSLGATPPSYHVLDSDTANDMGSILRACPYIRSFSFDFVEEDATAFHRWCGILLSIPSTVRSVTMSLQLGPSLVSLLLLMSPRSARLTK